MTGRKVRGCNVIAANAAGEILLVRHYYHLSTLWMLPGGGMGRDKDPIQSARRELREETGCDLADAIFVDTVVLDNGTWTNVVELVFGRAIGNVMADGREIEEARFHNLKALPTNVAESTRRMLEVWSNSQNGNSA